MKKMVLISVAGLLMVLVPKQVMAYGTSPGPAGPEVCSKSVPAKPWLYLAKYVKSGEVELKWDKVNDASSWTVAYGVQPGKYIYGISNFGDSNSRSINIKSLPAGKYYFAVKANNGCMPGAFSNEWPVVMKGKGSVVAVNKAVVKTKTVETGAIKTQEAKVTVAPVKEVVKKEVAPVVTKAPVVQEKAVAAPVTAPVAKKGGFMNWLLGLFK